MTHPSTPELCTLHAVRLAGMATDAAVVRRFSLDPVATRELLLDFEAYGWITWSEFAGIGGWSLTDAGRAENERRLADELERVGGVEPVLAAYRAFLPLNARLQKACTDWQLRPTVADPMAFNDHSDPDWDSRVLDELALLAHQLQPLAGDLSSLLSRFDGYHGRFQLALDRARAGDHAWVDRTTVDSCHKVWFELHEDLIATLGVPRGVEP